MKLMVLGSSGSEFPGRRTPGFMVDDSLLLDAGTIGEVLGEEEQLGLKNIMLTHSHLDHIKGIPFFVDNLILNGSGHRIIIRSIPAVLKTLKDNLFNNAVWPDFTVIPDKENSVLTLQEIETGSEYNINGYSIIAYEVTHSVPAVGYVIRDDEGKRLLYTGDTGSTDAIWAACDEPIDAAIIEVSMPNSMREMADMTGHLTSELLGAEIKKMKNIPRKILITHPKPQYISTIQEELDALGHDNIELLQDGKVYTI